MNFNEYQQEAQKTAIYPNKGNNYSYPVIGLTGEAGEVAEKIKKVVRDHGGIMTPEAKESVMLELGDVLWYVSALATEIGVTLEEVAMANIDKLTSRYNRDRIHGDGDDR